jgi:hypothetical protein
MAGMVHTSCQEGCRLNRPCKKTRVFLSFPYVCPEPVLVT